MVRAMCALFTSRLCLLAAVPLLAPMVGCRDTQTSDSLRTKQIAALIDVTSEGEGDPSVRVELAVGWEYGDLVKLEKGDVLTATSGEEKAVLKSSSAGIYTASLPVPGDGEVVIDFDRAEEQDAPSSKGTLPMPFLIHAPWAGEAFSRADEDLLVEWDDVANATGTIEFSGDCILTLSRDVTNELGYVTIPAGTLESATPNAPESCAVDIEIEIERDGTPDPALDGDSYFRAVQRRVVTIGSDP